MVTIAYAVNNDRQPASRVNHYGGDDGRPRTAGRKPPAVRDSARKPQAVEQSVVAPTVIKDGDDASDHEEEQQQFGHQQQAGFQGNHPGQAPIEYNSMNPNAHGALVQGIMHEKAEFEKRDAMRAQERPQKEDSGGGIRLSDARMYYFFHQFLQQLHAESNF